MRRIFHATLTAGFLGSTVLGAAAVTATLGLGGALMLPRGAEAGPFAPVVYVNNAAVTQYELDQRIRFMQVLRAPGADRESALKALIEDRLKLDAARQIGIAVSDQGLEQGLADFAGRANMDVGQFTEALARDGVDRQAYRDFVKAGVAWREVVRQRVVPRVQVTDREVEQAMKRDIETPITTAVLLSELVMPAPPGQEAAVLARGRQLSETITTEGAFAAAARRYSAVPTAPRGGRLEWTPLADLAPGLRQIIEGMRPNSISQPLTVPGAVVLFYLRDTRGRLRAGATDQTVEYVTLAVPSAADGAQVLARADSCGKVFVEANRYAGDVISQQTMPLSAVPLDIAQRLASLDPNEGTVIDYGAGARVVMLCRRTPTLADEPVAAFESLPGLPQPARRPDPVPGAAGQPGAAGATAAGGSAEAAANADRATTPAAAEAPNAANAATDAAAAAGLASADPPLQSRAQVREAIFNRKINAAADAYLAELRADAVIRKP